jgi:uncharacterized membrane protein
VVDELLEERRVSGGASGAGGPDDEGGQLVDVDREAARRLLARNERALARVADPRQRRQRAYALLARNGFDPETCREASAEFSRASEPDAGGPNEDVGP